MAENAEKLGTTEESPAVDVLAGMSEAQQAALLEKMLASKTLAKVGSKIVRAQSRANAEQAEVDKERKVEQRQKISSVLKRDIDSLIAGFVAAWENLGFESEQLGVEIVSFVQDGNQPGYHAGELRTNLTVAVAGIQSPLTIKSDGTVEQGKADTRTPDKGIVRAKAAADNDDAATA